MLELQKYYLGRILIYSRSVGNVFYKTSRGFVGPYKIGEVGLSDLYGIITFPNVSLSLPFNIEIKTGKGVLSKEQKKRRETALRTFQGFFEARDVKSFMIDFKKWEMDKWTKIKA